MCKIFRDFTSRIISPPEIIAFFPFQFDGLFLFLFLTWLLWLEFLWWIEVVSVDILCMSQRKAFTLFTTEYNVFEWRFSYMTFWCEIPSLLGMFFYHEYVLNFIRCIFCISRNDSVGFFPSFWYCGVLHWLTYICWIIFAFFPVECFKSQLEMVYKSPNILHYVC